MTRILTPGPNAAQLDSALSNAMAKQEQTEDVFLNLYAGAFAACAAMDFELAVKAEAERREREKSPDSEPFRLNLRADHVAQAALMYCKSALAVLAGQKRR